MLNKRILVLMFLLVFLPLAGCFPAPSNQAPIITSLPITAVTVGETYVYDVEATDPNADTLTYSLTTRPTGMTINPATGLIKWTPKVKGNYAVFVKVSDGALDITQSFTIVVSEPSAPPPVNHAPIITSIPNLTTIVGIQYTYTIKATDSDGDTLTYSFISGPVGMTFDGTATISWTPDEGQIGYNDVTVKASDGELSTPQSFTIIVSAAKLTSIVVEPDKISLFVGQTKKSINKITAHYEDGSTALIPVLIPVGGIPAYECKSSNVGVATVTDTGIVEGIAEGKSTITVTYQGEKDTVAVTVNPVLLTSIVVEPDEMTLFVGEGEAFKVTASYNDTTIADVTLGCVYEIDDIRIAEVKAGEVMAEGAGTATITIGYGGKTDTLAVTVEVRYSFTNTQSVSDGKVGDLVTTVTEDHDWMVWTFDFPVENFTGNGNLNVGLIIALDGEGQGPAFQIHNNDGQCDAYDYGTWLYSEWDDTALGNWNGWMTGDDTTNYNTPTADLDWVEASGNRKGQGTDGVMEIRIKKSKLGNAFHWAASPTVGSGFNPSVYDVTMQIPTAFNWGNSGTVSATNYIAR